MARKRRTGAPDHRRQISFELRAELSQQLDDHDLHVGSAQGLLRPARAWPGAEMAPAGAASGRFALQDVEGGRLAEDVWEALLQSVDDELGGERGEDHS